MTNGENIIPEEHLKFEDKFYCDLYMEKHSLRGYMGSFKENCRDVERNQRNYTPVSYVSVEITHSIHQNVLDFAPNKLSLFTSFTSK